MYTGQALEEITRADFEAFAEEYQSWYLRVRTRTGHTDHRVARIERFLIHWKIIPPKRRVFRHEEYFLQIQHTAIQEALLRYLKWGEVFVQYRHHFLVFASVATEDFERVGGGHRGFLLSSTFDGLSSHSLAERGKRGQSIFSSIPHLLGNAV